MNRDGFLIRQRVFSHGECDLISGHLSNQNNKKNRAGIRNLMSVPLIREFANDERLITILKECTGKAMIPFKATLFEKTGRSNWLVAFHQDTALPIEELSEPSEWGPMSVKEGVIFAHAPARALAKIIALRIHLDASESMNGPLRIIPGSHGCRLSEDELESWRKKDAITCTVEKGGVIAMSPLILHASSKSTNDQPRRVLHIEYAESMQIDENVKLAIS
jgi:ectoine hydroxylase-related dioxygenase (phytanoyl-CoA dioxygenase family)